MSLLKFMDSKIYIKFYNNKKSTKKLNKIAFITADIHIEPINFKNPSMPHLNETVDVQ